MGLKNLMSLYIPARSAVPATKDASGLISIPQNSSAVVFADYHPTMKDVGIIPKLDDDPIPSGKTSGTLFYILLVLFMIVLVFIVYVIMRYVR